MKWKQFMDVISYREQLQGHSFFLFKLFSEEESNAHSTDPLACIVRVCQFEADTSQSKFVIFDREQLERISFFYSSRLVHGTSTHPLRIP